MPDDHLRLGDNSVKTPLLTQQESSDGVAKKPGLLGSVRSALARFTRTSSKTLNPEQDMAARASLDEGDKAIEKAPPKLTQSFTSSLSEKLTQYKESIAKAWNSCFSSNLDKTEESKSEDFWEKRNKDTAKGSMDVNLVRAHLKDLSNHRDKELDRENPPSFIKSYVQQKVNSTLQANKQTGNEQLKKELTTLYTNEVCKGLEEIARHPDTDDMDYAASLFLNDKLPTLESEVLTKLNETSLKKGAEAYYSRLPNGQKSQIDRDNPPAFIKEHVEKTINDELEGAAKYFRHEVQEDASFFQVFKETKTINDYKADVKEKLKKEYTEKLCSELENSVTQNGENNASHAASNFENRVKNISIALLFKDVAESNAQDRKKISEPMIVNVADITTKAQKEFNDANTALQNAESRVTSAKNASMKELFDSEDKAKANFEKASENLTQITSSLEISKEELTNAKVNLNDAQEAFDQAEAGPNKEAAENTLNKAKENVKTCEDVVEQKTQKFNQAKLDFNTAKNAKTEAEESIKYANLDQAKKDLSLKTANFKSKEKALSTAKEAEKSLRKEVYQTDQSIIEKDQWMTSFLSYKETHTEMLKIAQKPHEYITMEEGYKYLNSLSDHIENMEAMGAKEEDINVIKENSTKVALSLLDQADNLLEEKPSESARLSYVSYANKVLELSQEKDSPIQLTEELSKAITEAKTNENPADYNMQSQVSTFLSNLDNYPERYSANDLPPSLQKHIEDHVDLQLKGTGRYLRGSKEKRSKLGSIGAASQAHHINVFKKETRKELIDAYKKEVFENLKTSTGDPNERALNFQENILPKISVAEIFLTLASSRTKQKQEAEGITDFTESNSRRKDAQMRLFLGFKERHSDIEKTAETLDANAKSLKENANAVPKEISLAQGRKYIDKFKSHLDTMKTYSYPGNEIKHIRDNYQGACAVVLSEGTKRLEAATTVKQLDEYIKELKSDMVEIQKNKDLFSEKELAKELTNASKALTAAGKKKTEMITKAKNEFDSRHSDFTAFSGTSPERLSLQNSKFYFNGLSTHVTQMNQYKTPSEASLAVKMGIPNVGIALLRKTKESIESGEGPKTFDEQMKELNTAQTKISEALRFASEKDADEAIKPTKALFAEKEKLITEKQSRGATVDPDDLSLRSQLAAKIAESDTAISRMKEDLDNLEITSALTTKFSIELIEKEMKSIQSSPNKTAKEKAGELSALKAEAFALKESIPANIIQKAENRLMKAQKELEEAVKSDKLLPQVKKRDISYKQENLATCSNVLTDLQKNFTNLDTTLENIDRLANP